MVHKSSALASGTGGGTGGSVISLQGLSGALNLTSTGNTISITPSGSTIDIEALTGGSGSVTSVSGVTANGFAFSITNPTINPAITAETTITGILQGNGTAISAVPNAGISNALLANSAITVDAGTGLSGGGSVALGSSITLALTNTSLTVSGVSGVTGGGTVALGGAITLGMADSIANTLAGYNSSGIFSNVSIGTNLSLVGGVLTASGSSGGGSVTSVTGNNGVTASPTTGAVIVGLSSIVSNSVLANATGTSAIPAALAATTDNTYLVRSGGVISWSYGAGPIIDVRAYGAVPDCRRLTDISATSGSTAISSIGAANFTSSDTNKIINLYDYNNFNYVARSVFTYVSATSGTLSIAAGNNLSAANCIGYIGTDNTAAITNAISIASINLSPKSQGPNLALGGGDTTVIFPSDSRGNMYAHSGQIYVDTNVIIDAQAMIVPMYGSASTNIQGNANKTYPWVMLPGANIRNLQMFCNYTQGITLGTMGQQSHSRIDWLTMWDVGSNNASGSIIPSSSISNPGSGYKVGDTITLTGGTATQQAILTVQSVASGGLLSTVYPSNPGLYSVVPSNPVSQGSTTGSGTGATFSLNNTPSSHIGLTVNGNDYFINQFWEKSGNIGILFAGSNDVLANSIFLIGSSTGLSAQGCEEIFIGNVQCDTTSYECVVIDSTHNLRIANGNAFSINAVGATTGLCLGQNSTTPNDNININWSTNRSGGDSIRIANTTGYLINHNTTNSSLYGGGGVAINNAVVYGSSVGSGILTQNRDPAITAFTGTVGGILNDNAGGVYKQYAGYTDGQILVGNSLTGAIAPSTISAGNNITITNSHGVIGITSTASGGSGSGITRSINSVSTNTTAGSTASIDYVYLCSSTMTLTLPVASGNTNLYTVKNIGIGTVTTTSATSIDGMTTIVNNTRYQSDDFISNSSSWYIV